MDVADKGSCDQADARWNVGEDHGIEQTNALGQAGWMMRPDWRTLRKSTSSPSRSARFP
jgi:hypothetical protein